MNTVSDETPESILDGLRDDSGLSAALIIQQGLVEPALKFEQVSQLPAGLARFLVDQINAISGVSTPRDALEELVTALESGAGSLACSSARRGLAFMAASLARRASSYCTRMNSARSARPCSSRKSA